MNSQNQHTVRRIGQYPGKLRFYQNRSELHQKITEAFNSPQHTAALCGSIGVGKTSEALAYIHDQVKHDPYELIIWINCNDFSNECQAAENQLGIPPGNLYSHLAQFNSKWLVILDDAKNSNLKHLPNTVNGHVLVTSREDTWENTIRVSGFTREESRNLITSTLNREVDTPATIQRIIGIADELEDYPAAISWAAEEILLKENQIQDYHHDLLQQTYYLYPTKALPKKFYDTIAGIVDQVQTQSQTAYELLCAFSHLNSAFIPRDLIYSIIEADPTFQADTAVLTAIINDTNATAEAKKDAETRKQAEAKNRVNSTLAFLKQQGLIDIKSQTGKPCLISLPVLSSLRMYFSSRNDALYQNKLWLITDKLIKANENEQRSTPQDNKHRFYYMHTKTLVDRLLGIIPYDTEEYNERIQKDTDRVVRNLTHTSPMEFTNIGRLTLSDEQFCNTLELTVSLANLMFNYDELDGAYFYLNIAQIALEQRFPTLSTANRASATFYNDVHTNWTADKRKFLLCQKILDLKGSVEARRTIEPDPIKFTESSNLLSDSQKLLSQAILESQADPNEAQKFAESLFHTRRLWIYSLSKMSRSSTASEVEKFNVSENAGTIDLTYTAPNGTANSLLQFNTNNKTVKLSNIVSDGHFIIPAQTITLGDKKLHYILSVYGLLAFIAKQKEKHERHPRHRYQELKMLHNKESIKELLVRDILDEQAECYEFDKMLALIFDVRGKVYRAPPDFNEFKRKLLDLRRDARWRHHQRLSKGVLLTDSAINQELSTLAKEIYQAMPVAKEKKLKATPYEDAINLLENGIKFYQQQINKPTSNYQLVFYYRKLGRYYLDRYRAYKENDSGSKEELKKTLSAAWLYYKKAKIACLDYYHRDEPIIEVATIFIGLLSVLEKFKEEGIDLPRDWDNDKQKDHFLRCRFILSQLHNDAYHYARKLLELCHKLKLSPQTGPVGDTNIFDLVISPSHKYYESKLNTAYEKLQRNPEDMWRVFSRANTMLALGMHQAAIDEFNKFLAVYPYSSTALSCRAFAEFKAGNYDAALVDLETAKSIHGHRDSLVTRYNKYCKQAIAIKTMDIKEIAPPASKPAIFIECLRAEFAKKLQSSIEKSLGQDKRLSGSSVAARLAKSVVIMLPKSLAAMGFSTDIPIGEGLSGIIDTFEERKALREAYKHDKVFRANIVPNELKTSEVFTSVLNQLTKVFKDYFKTLTYDGTKDFAKYLAESMIDHLGSDRVLAYLPLEEQLLKGAMEGHLASLSWLSTEGHKLRFWRAQGIVKHSDIRTPDGVLFSLNRPIKKYLERAGTEEEARALGYEEVPNNILKP